MAPPRRKVLETEEETLTPPPVLPPGHQIARVIKATGNNIYSVELPSSSSLSSSLSSSTSSSSPSKDATILVELHPRFRSTIWIKRGSYVLVDTNVYQERGNKLSGEIVNVVRDEKAWRKVGYWPKEFVKQPAASLVEAGEDDDDDDEEQSRVGKMPPSDESDA